MAEGLALQKHGTKLMQLKPNNIVQAARADLRLLERKKTKTADPEEKYSFARKHVQKANDIGHLIALAYFDPNAAKSTDKKSTYIVYEDRDLLKATLLGILTEEIVL